MTHLKKSISNLNDEIASLDNSIRLLKSSAKQNAKRGNSKQVKADLRKLKRAQIMERRRINRLTTLYDIEYEEAKRK